MSLSPPPSEVPLIKEPMPDSIWKRWFYGIYDYFGGDLWDDELASLTPGKTPAANAPTWTAFGPSGTCYQWAFGLNDHIQSSGFHITHTIKPGSKIYPHIHWSTDGVDTNTVKWQLSYTLAKGHDQEAFPADVTMNLEQAGSGTAWQHMIAEASDAQAIDAPEVDSLLILDVKRITNGGTDNADTVYGLYVDLHYQKDRFGTPRKSPNFYVR